MAMMRAEIVTRVAEYRRLTSLLNRRLTIAVVTFLVGATLLASWMERSWGSRANWPYALLILILSGGGIGWYLRHTRGLARRLGIGCAKCGFPVFREADLQAGKCSACGAP